MFIEIDGILINPKQIVSAEVITTHYFNMSVSHLVVNLTDGRQVRKEHGYGFNAWATLDKIRKDPT